MDSLLAITWSVQPDIFSLGPFTIRWYGLFFASGFLLGYYMTQRVFKAEKANQAWLDSLLIFLVVGTIIGARLGHVLFYNWPYYRDNPVAILKVWEGGLASHGGTIGVIIALLLWSRYVSKKSLFWISDRLMMSIALTACFIRLGNLMNSEIYGSITDVPWGFIFTEAPGTDSADPRHPTQIYEALSYLGIFLVTFFLFWKSKLKQRQGFISGLFLVLLFTARFFIEYVKVEQAEHKPEWLEGIMAQLTMGQILSIPFILLGIAFMVYAYTRPPVEAIAGKKK